MKPVRYTVDAAKDLKRHGNVADRIRRAIAAHAADDAAHSNNIRPLVGTKAKRLRVGDFRVIFEETEEQILVTKIGPRGSVYE